MNPTLQLERRRAFQACLEAELRRRFGVARMDRTILRSDRTHAIGGAYPRYVWSTGAAIAVDESETPATIDGILRSAILWQDRVRRPLYVIVPAFNTASLVPRLLALKRVQRNLRWLEWDGAELRRLNLNAAGATASWVQEYSGGLRRSGIERVRTETRESVLQDLLVRNIDRVIPGVRADYVYPQVPSFIDGHRDVLDLLTISSTGRLVIVEVKAARDPELPFQALDYWLAVSRHHQLGEFERKGYFPGLTIRPESPILLTVAPLLAYHRTFDRLIAEFPARIPLQVLGISENWRRGIKVLRRAGGSVRLWNTESQDDANHQNCSDRNDTCAAGRHNPGTGP